MPKEYITLNEAGFLCRNVICALLDSNCPSGAWKLWKELPHSNRLAPSDRFVYELKRRSTGIEVRLRLDREKPSALTCRLREPVLSPRFYRGVEREAFEVRWSESKGEKIRVVKEAAWLAAVSSLVCVREKDYHTGRRLAELARRLGDQVAEPVFGLCLCAMGVDALIASGKAEEALQWIALHEHVDSSDPGIHGELLVKKAAAHFALDCAGDRRSIIWKNIHEAVRCVQRPAVGAWYPGWVATKAAEMDYVSYTRGTLNLIGLAWDLTDPGNKAQRALLKRLARKNAGYYGKDQAGAKEQLNCRYEESALAMLFGTDLPPPMRRSDLVRLAKTSPDKESISSQMGL